MLHQHPTPYQDLNAVLTDRVVIGNELAALFDYDDIAPRKAVKR